MLRHADCFCVCLEQHWLTSHEECWDDIQAQLLDAGHTSYDAYSDIEPNMITLDEQGAQAALMSLIYSIVQCLECAR